MNKIGFLVLLLCLQGIFSVLTQKKSQLKASNHHARHSKRNLLKLQFQAKAVLDELNDYRRQNIFSDDIKWSKNLANTAAQEAFELANDKGQFSDHRHFKKWSQGYKGFTEIVVNYHTQKGFTRRAFSQGVLQAIVDKYRSNLVSKFKYGGISIFPDANNYNKYVVVLHLAANGNGNSKNLKDFKKLKFKKPNDLIRTYASCKEAQTKKEEKNWIKTPDGKTMKCEQKFDKGGWSRVLDAEWKGSAVEGIIPIDDRNIKFKEILFKAKDEYHLNVAGGKTNYYDFDGYSFRYNALKIGGLWYVHKASKGYQRAYAKQYNFEPNRNNVKIFKKATKCYYSSTQELSNCGKIFKFIQLPPGRLTAFADTESTMHAYYGDNIFKYYFELFVR